MKEIKKYFLSPQPEGGSGGLYRYKEYYIRTTKSGGKAGKGHNTTASLLVFIPIRNTHMIKHSTRFIVGDKDSYDKAWSKIIEWVNKNSKLGFNKMVKKKKQVKAIYFCDTSDDMIKELEDIQQTLHASEIFIDIELMDLPPKDGFYYDIMFFDWGGMSIGNSLLEHFCERWIEDARNKPDRIYIMTSSFTERAMADLRGYSEREVEEFPKNIFMDIKSAIPYLKVLIL